MPAKPSAGLSTAGEALSRARAGDPSALDALAREHLPLVERLLGRLLGPRQDMEDLVQTVFFEMCRSLHGFRGDSAVGTFIGGITVRVARRAMRPSAWWSRRSPTSEAPEPTFLGGGPERDAVAAERIRRLQRALESIAPRKRVAFLLWALDGMDIDGIAKITGASVVAVRARIFHARKELRSVAAQDPHLAELMEEIDHAE